MPTGPGNGRLTDPGRAGRARPANHGSDGSAPRPAVLRLGTGMVQINRRPMLPAGLARVLAAGLVSTAIGVLSPSIWTVADSMPPWRLAAAVLGAIALHTGWLIVARRQRARRDTPRQRTRPGIVRRNAAIVTTVVLGAATFTALLFLLALTTLSVLVTPQHLGAQLGHAVGPVDYLGPALLAAVLGTVGAAIGSWRAPTRRSAPATPAS